jgi:D-arabinose 1-dehydrogenase-like Zn-dependent alcohol dehydrogenase
MTYGGYSAGSSSTNGSACTSRGGPGGRRAAVVRGHHDILTLSMGAPGKAPRSASSASAAPVIGVKLPHASAPTVLFTTSPGKTADAKRLGADETVVSKDAEAMWKHVASFDLILNTVAASHDLDAYTALLKRDGTMVLIGVPERPHPSPNVGLLIFKRRRIAGSLIGGIPETQEMLDFCAQHDIACDIELIPIQKIDEA